jgi:hypothetical protein
MIHRVCKLKRAGDQRFGNLNPFGAILAQRVGFFVAFLRNIMLEFSRLTRLGELASFISACNRDSNLSEALFKPKRAEFFISCTGKAHTEYFGDLLARQTWKSCPALSVPPIEIQISSEAVFSRRK